MEKKKFYTKKTRFIDALSLLTEMEKDEVKNFFSKYPVYESRIDWNNKNLRYSDFQQVFKLAENSSGNMKRNSKENPLALFSGYNCKIIAQTEEFLIVLPLDWKCAVFFNSFSCGGEGARWCIGDKKSDVLWDFYSDTGSIFFFVYFLNRDIVLGKKIMIEYNANIDYYGFYFSGGRYFWDGLKNSELLCRFFRISTRNRLRKSLWYMFLIYERNIYKQQFFEFDIFKKVKIQNDRIKSFERVIKIFNFIDEVKHIIDRKDVVSNQEKQAGCTFEELLYQKDLADCPIKELLYFLKKEKHSENMIRCLEIYINIYKKLVLKNEIMYREDIMIFFDISALFYEKDITLYKTQLVDYTTIEQRELLKNLRSFSWFQHNFENSQVTLLEIIQELIEKILEVMEQKMKQNLQ